MEGIHKEKQRLKTQIKKIRESDEILECNRKLILKFYDECYSQGLGDTRVLFYMVRLWVLAKGYKKDFSKLNKEDIKTLVRNIENSDYSVRTKHDYRLTIKKFWQWLDGHEWKSGIYSDRVSWISLSLKKKNNKLPEEILTKKDVLKLIKTADNVRDKALISSLYESGCRIGELLGLRIKDLTFDDYGAVAIVNGKTGVRRVRLVSSASLISNWLEYHPNRNSEKSFLWTGTTTNNNYADRLSYDYIRTRIKEIAKKSGIEKDVNPHAFRHSRATHLANKLTEAQMKILFGWTKDSNMASVYVHLSGRDVDNAILRIHGKLSENEEKKDEEIKSIQCPRCRYENLTGSDFCGRCRLPLTEKTALELREKEKQFLQMITPDIIEKLIERKVQEIVDGRTQVSTQAIV